MLTDPGAETHLHQSAEGAPYTSVEGTHTSDTRTPSRADTRHIPAAKRYVRSRIRVRAGLARPDTSDEAMTPTVHTHQAPKARPITA